MNSGKFKFTKLFFVLLGIILFLSAALSSFLYFSFRKVFVAKNSNIINLGKTSPTPTIDPQSPFGILLMGYGGAGHDGPYLTDTMILLYVEPKIKKVIFISIPRDTWIALPTNGDNKEYTKINAAYSIGIDDTKYPNKKPIYQGLAGGGEIAKYAVNTVTGLPVSYYATIDFSGFTQIVDLLGGIQVNVPITFEDNFYPIEGKENDNCGKTDDDIKALTATISGFLLEQHFPCRYEKLHYDKGLQTMNGATALKFVRSRHSDTDGGDFARSDRQFAVLTGLRNKMLSLGTLTKIIPLVEKVSNSIRTDINPGVIQKYLPYVGNLSDWSLISIHLTTDNVYQESTSSDGQYILIPKSGVIDNWNLIHSYIDSQINSATPSSSLN